MLVIAALGMGGAERALSNLANGFAGQGAEVTVIACDAAETPSHFPLNPDIEVRRLGLQKDSTGLLDGIRNNVTRVRALRNAIREHAPDAVISFGDQLNVLAIVAGRLAGRRVIVSERTDPSRHDIGRLWNTLRDLTYRWADAVVCQTARVSGHVAARCNCRCETIPNPVPRPSARANGFGFISVGRLAEEKGHADLVTAFARLGKAAGGRRLTLVGDGPEEAALKQLAKDLGVDEAVDFTGRVADVTPYLCKADIFVLPSRYEGFPNALCEAMACGLAPISYDCKSGPAEIIDHGVNGLLVPEGDVGGLEAAMRELAENDSLRRSMADKAVEVTKNYSLDAVLGQWTACIGSVMGKN